MDRVDARFHKVRAFVQTALHLVVEGDLLFVFLLHKLRGENELGCCYGSDAFLQTEAFDLRHTWGSVSIFWLNERYARCEKTS